MKVLHVNDADLRGRRFNGYDLLSDMRSRGVSSTQAVLTKQSQNPDVLSLFEGPMDDALNDALWRVEQRNSMSSLLYPWARLLGESPAFAEADVVHYHLIHNRMLSLLDMPALFARKPSVWTFHDPWVLTGHCLYPMDCKGWVDGCDPCPFLDRRFAMKQDCAGQMWSVKRDVYAQLDVDVVVASEFMLDMVRRSPLTSHFEHVHQVPFGIEIAAFLPDSERAASRQRLGIPSDDLVLFFRSCEGEFKGTDKLIDALRSSAPSRPTTLLTVDATGLLRELRHHYNIVEFGWVEDESLYPRLFSACDMFVMPSMTEAFGLMALEAMAAGRPVVCFQDTSIAAVTHAPECGIAVPLGDSVALRKSIDALAADPADAQRRGLLGRELASSEYNHEGYLDSLLMLYRGALSRRGLEPA
jgi:glycosyltransferase involved in cell wall biosynthesis